MHAVKGVVTGKSDPHLCTINQHNKANLQGIYQWSSWPRANMFALNANGPGFNPLYQLLCNDSLFCQI